ncbi:MAG: family 10 glycosylhydrolase [Moorea sp. SIO1F2]|uniref:family 10 glycosylhydrolase n=1 Tax=Moorena sp. SIO1F2 TaxID=2607819 RepID=UPI0013B83915|nr:family 10 glycosylhydrolase [Moorena sp. SIO1F2]NET82166.1 family 10 glycosylhydrolase [Moorena sp. SIO1F2]
MSNKNNENSGCGCANIPISLILLVLGGGYWWLNHQGGFAMISKLPQNLPIAIPKNLPITIPGLNSTPAEPQPSAPTQPSVTTAPSLPNSPIVKPNHQPASSTPQTAQKPQTPQTAQKLQKPQTPIVKPNHQPASPTTQTPLDKKAIRGIYISRYKVTNNASEEKIRKQVRHYHSQGINTIIHGVWGNICPMYTSEVMQKTFGYKSCPNQFRDRWLTWLIDEAHKHGMEVHAYFEKGIKIDKNSPIFDLAIERKWVVPGVDRTYPGIEHYILDVEIPEVANFFRDILVEFVQKYPKIDAVQWDDYLGYHAELPGKVNRTNKLTAFSQEMIGAMKQANPKVSFDLCHHNPYWAKKYFAADWPKWNVDRVFIQAYNDKNFTKEVDYAETYDGIAITDKQFHRLPEIVANNKIKAILVFPDRTNPEDVASKLKQFYVK